MLITFDLMESEPLSFFFLNHKFVYLRKATVLRTDFNLTLPQMREIEVMGVLWYHNQYQNRDNLSPRFPGSAWRENKEI